MNVSTSIRPPVFFGAFKPIHSLREGQPRLTAIVTGYQTQGLPRCLSDSVGLLNEWRTQIVASRRSLVRQRYYVPGGESITLAPRLAELCEDAEVEYAIAQEGAAQAYAPFLSSISRVACRMAPGKAANAVMARLEARVVTEGSNLDFIETKSRSEFQFKEQRNALWLASPVQVYLDLLRGDGRSRDMAEHLRKELLGP